MKYQIQVEPIIDTTIEKHPYILINFKCHCKRDITMRTMLTNVTCPHTSCVCGQVFKHKKVDTIDIIEIYEKNYKDPNQLNLWS